MAKMTRLLYIDILKGWAILCIVLLHFEEGIFPRWLNTWIGLFMISAFYFTSGWLTGIKQNNLTVKELVSKRWQTLGKPYFYFSVLILLFDILLWTLGHYDLKFIAREIFKSVTFRGVGTLWFLPALFGGEIIFRYLLNKNKWLITLMVLLLTLTYLHFYHYWQTYYRNIGEIYQLIDAPFYTIHNILKAWPVIGIAYLLSKHFNLILTKMKSFRVFLLGLMITIISIYVNGGFCPISFGFFSPLFKPIVGPLGLLLLAFTLKKGIIITFLSFWGVNSLVMMVTHYSFLLVISQILDQALFHTPFSGVRTLVWFVITVIAEYPIVWFFNYKAKWMLGKS